MAKKIGLVLGSGGMRGLAHISVIEYLVSLGVHPDYVAGASIGSIIGALYCAGKMDDFKRDFFSMTKAQVIKYFYPALSKSGLLNADKIIDYIREYIPDDALIEDLKVPLAIVATNYSTGTAVVFRKGKILTAVRASISIPGVFIPVSYNGSLLVDGGVINPLPIDVVKEMGAEIIIAVNLQPAVHKRSARDAEKNKASASSVSLLKPKYVEMIKRSWKLDMKNNWLSSWLEIRDKKKDMKKKDMMPNMFGIMMQTIQILMYQNTQFTLMHHKPDVLIEPDLLDVSWLDFSKSKNALEEGAKACESVREKLLEISRDIR
ncbi:MAG: patatin-like phospholipase family protein [archaeon]